MLTATPTRPNTAPPPPCPPSPDINDPPPPYPTPGRRTRRSGRRQNSAHAQISSTESEHESYPPEAEDADGLREDEGAPFLRRGRPRSGSHLSATPSVAPSLAQTIASIFHLDDDEGDGDCRLPEGDEEEGAALHVELSEPRRWSWRRYFRPMTRRIYYRALFHLYIVNFPFALAAFLSAFVLTVTGTTLLVALPIGALLCFCNLLCVRTFSRGELALQTRFHSPLAYPAPHPPRPIFIRMRESLGTGPTTPEPSFYKNSYAMFTDPTSYQALFYFIVIKPCITLLLSLALIVLGVPAIALVLPAPMAFRAIRKLGVWQANVAVEGLYLAHVR
ncbi:hypothetical protein MKEN_00464300 [Mycena kentingensis (nom. inval.)]|nr:hypothetical protein MKEN_00464300 [Mycena kentingensis (nom. inval.)]